MGNCTEKLGNCNTNGTHIEGETAVTWLTNPTPKKPCIRDSDRCHWARETGDCCRGDCVYLKGEEYGYCGTAIFNSSTELPPTTTTSTEKPKPCIQDAESCHWTGVMGDCCKGDCVHPIGGKYGYCRTAISTSTEPTTSTTNSTDEPKPCIHEANRCHWTGVMGDCCEGECVHPKGDEYGYCGTAISNSTEPPPSTTSTACIPNADPCELGLGHYCCSGWCNLLEGYCVEPPNNLPKKEKPCIQEADRCHRTGAIGDCCTGACYHPQGEEYGYCVTISKSTSPSPPTTKCLEAGADCKTAESCCVGYCQVNAKRPIIGVCVPPKIKPHETGQVENDHSWVIYTSIALSLFILLVVGFVWLYCRQKKLVKGLTRRDTNAFLNGNPRATHMNEYAHQNVDNLPYNKELEIPESDFSVDFESKLGSGCFGLVLKGTVRNVEVAVKTIPSNVTDELYIRSLLSEIKTLQYIGSFENIVSLVGSNTSNLEKGEVFLFLEYCPLGSLEEHLRKNKHNFVDFPDNGSDNSGILDSAKLLQWSLQITNAMKFLAAKKVIHADVATRNVLLYTMDCVKLTDFGLSRKLYHYGNYQKKQREPLPWRWMALESLTQLSFSHQSDVWSLAITFWEIFTLGDAPYPQHSWNDEFVACLQNGLRPTKPSIASDELYGIMMDCWKLIPDSRPKFEDIYRRLDEYQKNNAIEVS